MPCLYIWGLALGVSGGQGMNKLIEIIKSGCGIALLLFVFCGAVFLIPKKWLGEFIYYLLLGGLLLKELIIRLIHL